MKAITYNQKYFKHILKKDMVAIDMTLGLGNDSLYLAKKVKKVYAFDIQDRAIQKAQKRLRDYDNIQYILDDHAKVDEYVKEKVDIVFFNLGYLPYSDNSIVTSPSSSIIAFEKAMKLLKDNGYISIIFYRGHVGGLLEFHSFMKFLNQKQYSIIDIYHNYQSRLEPILYIIKKGQIL